MISIEDLPPEILTVIFKRTDKYVFAAKLVSKQWYNIITENIEPPAKLLKVMPKIMLLD